MTSNPTFRPGLKAVAPSAEDLIADLIASHMESDPEDDYGFSSREIWDYRYATFGYTQLFSDWLLIATV